MDYFKDFKGEQKPQTLVGVDSEKGFKGSLAEP
jgi:hypothetical protein